MDGSKAFLSIWIALQLVYATGLPHGGACRIAPRRCLQKCDGIKRFVSPQPRDNPQSSGLHEAGDNPPDRIVPQCEYIVMTVFWAVQNKALRRAVLAPPGVAPAKAAASSHLPGHFCASRVDAMEDRLVTNVTYGDVAGTALRAGPAESVAPWVAYT